MSSESAHWITPASRMYCVFQATIMLAHRSWLTARVAETFESNSYN